MDATDPLNLAVITPIPNIGSHCDVIDSYRLEENDTIFPIHILDMIKGFSNYDNGENTVCETTTYNLSPSGGYGITTVGRDHKS